MIYHVIPAVIIIALIVIGHIIKRVRISKLNKRCEFTVDFNNNFFEMANDMVSHGRIDNQKYTAVIKDVDKIQEELGQDGVLDGYIDNLRGVKGTNYQLFMNIMPEIRSYMASMDNSIMRERLNQLMGLCEDALKRHLGNLERAIEQVGKGLFNPITCMGEGIRWCVGLPVDILQWAGLYNASRGSKIKGSWLFKLIGNIGVLVGLVSSVMSVIMGWDEFIEIVLNCFGRK